MKPTKRKRVCWDEKNLEEIEKDKPKEGYTRIDEPKTPYNFEYHEDSDQDENAEKASSVQKLNSDLSAALQEVADSRMNREEIDVEDFDREKEILEKRKHHFEERRREHYDEYRTMRRLREQGVDFDRDEVKVHKVLCDSTTPLECDSPAGR